MNLHRVRMGESGCQRRGGFNFYKSVPMLGVSVQFIYDEEINCYPVNNDI